MRGKKTRKGEKRGVIDILQRGVCLGLPLQALTYLKAVVKREHCWFVSKRKEKEKSKKYMCISEKASCLQNMSMPRVIESKTILVLFTAVVM